MGKDPNKGNKKDTKKNFHECCFRVFIFDFEHKVSTELYPVFSKSMKLF